MTTVYLIRHSLKEKNYGCFDSNDTAQIRNEKFILSVSGEEKARELAKLDELNNVKEVWSSNYVRAIQTAKYIASRNNVRINISSSFDERHYGTFGENVDKQEFWIEQFKNSNLKNIDGESQLDVQNRMDTKIKEIINNNKGEKVAIVCHNACTLFYLLKYCKLERAEVKKKLTISYNNKIIVNETILESPCIIKLVFDDNNLVDLKYIVLN